MRQFEVGYDKEKDAYVAAASVNTMIGTLPVFVSVPLKPIAEQVAKLILDREAKRSGVTRNEVGFFGFQIGRAHV